jgi:hypothetical protein
VDELMVGCPEHVSIRQLIAAILTQRDDAMSVKMTIL